MKKLLFQSLVLCAISLSVSAKENSQPNDLLRASPKFVETCPEKFLDYIDKAEGGPGFYCAE